MPDSFLMLWSADRYQRLRKLGHIGRPITRLFGGPHTSLPAIQKYGVQPGDFLYPITTVKGSMLILGRMQVIELLDIALYELRHPGSIPSPAWKYTVSGGTWPDSHAELRYLAPTCCDEVAIGVGTPIGLDIEVPGDSLHTITFKNKRSVRPLNNVVDGKLKNVLSIQGHTLKLSTGSAKLFDDLIGTHLAG